jgi:hypothetical protein
MHPKNNNTDYYSLLRDVATNHLAKNIPLNRITSSYYMTKLVQSRQIQEESKLHVQNNNFSLYDLRYLYLRKAKRVSFMYVGLPGLGNSVDEEADTVW